MDYTYLSFIEDALSQGGWIPMEFAVHVVDAARDLASAAKVQAMSFKSQAEEAARMQRLWDDLMVYLIRGWPLHVLAQIDKAAPQLKALRAENHPTIPAIEDGYRVSKEQGDVLLRRFPAFLAEACQVANLPLDQESRHPRYTFRNRFFNLDVDEQKRTAKLSDREGKLAEFPADLGAIVDALQREQKRIFERTFDGRKFLKLLRNQYLAVAKWR